MITVGAFEAKTHLSGLLERVAGGEDVLITKHGRPIARLTRVDAVDTARINDTIAKLKALRKGTTLGGDWKAYRDEGRP